jgi:uncharacterized protein YbbC (DUF1343 family)
MRVGLVSHTAAIDCRGRLTADRLHDCPDADLVALYGPEHGFDRLAAAGESTRDTRHAAWGIPVYSLYGDTRRPSPAMLDGVDVLVVDFQDLGARPYTYVSTLRLVLEAAAESGKRVVVADRPVPLAGGCDGPVLDPACESFVGLVGTSFQYGMTPGETAGWIVRWLGLDLDLRVATLRGYARDASPGPDWPPWVPPSPRIRSWECGALFTCTVAGEALPAVDYGSGTPQSFQLIGAPWLPAQDLILRLRSGNLTGVDFESCVYVAQSGLYAGQHLDGMRIVVTDAARFKPVTTSVSILAALQAIGGADRLWSTPGTRPEFFDKLFGTPVVREALRDGAPGPAVAALWQADARLFAADRQRSLLYPDGSCRVDQCATSNPTDPEPSPNPNRNRNPNRNPFSSTQC